MSSLEGFPDNGEDEVVERLQNMILGDPGEYVVNLRYLRDGISTGVSILNPPHVESTDVVSVSGEFRLAILQLLKGGGRIVVNPDGQIEASEGYKTAARAITSRLLTLGVKDTIFFNKVLEATYNLVGKFPTEFLPLFWGGIMAVYMVYYK